MSATAITLTLLAVVFVLPYIVHIFGTSALPGTSISEDRAVTWGFGDHCQGVAIDTSSLSVVEAVLV